MSVDIIDLESPDRDYGEMRVTQGSSISAQDSRVSSLPLCFETRQNGFFSLKNSSHKFKPMMSRITNVSISYEHTRPDGRVDGVKIDIDLTPDTSGDSASTGCSDDGHDIDHSDRNTDES